MLAEFVLIFFNKPDERKTLNIVNADHFYEKNYLLQNKSCKY